MREIKRIAKFGFDNKSVFNLEDTPDDSDLPEDMGKDIDDTPIRQESKAEAKAKVIAALRSGRDATVSDVFSPYNTPKATTLNVKTETTTDLGFKDTKIIDTGQPLDTTSAKNLLKKFDDRIELAEEVLNYTDPNNKNKVLSTSDIGMDVNNIVGSGDITIESKGKWEAELAEATQAKADYIAEVNIKSGWAGADEIIDVETEKKLRHQAFTSGVISDLNTSRPQDIAAMVDMKNTGEFTSKEFSVSRGAGSKANEALDSKQVGRDVRFALSTVEEGRGVYPKASDVRRDMHVEQMGVGNFHETSLEERAAVSGVEAQYEYIEDPKTGKKKRTLVAPDLGVGKKLGGAGGQDFNLSSKMSRLVEGLGVPDFARTKSGMVFGEEKWTGDQTKFGIKEWEEAAAQHYGGKKTPGYKAYMEAALTPRIDSEGIGISKNPQLMEMNRVHNKIIENAVFRKVIKKDILNMAAGHPEYGYASDKKGWDISKPKSREVSKKMLEAYFRGDFGESTMRNTHSAKVMGVSNLKGINVPLQEPDILFTGGELSPEVKTQLGADLVKTYEKNFGTGQRVASYGTYFGSHRSTFDDTIFTGALGKSVVDEVARPIYGTGSDYSLEMLQREQRKSAGTGGAVVNNPESSTNTLADGRNNTQFPRKEEVSSARDARIRNNITKFKGGHRFIPGAIALKGIIGLHKGGGGADKFSK